MAGARVKSLLAAVYLSALPFAVFAQNVENLDIRAHPIKQFHVRKQAETFGAFTFVGGLIFRSSHPNFGGLSGFRFLDDAGQKFVAVSDFGYLLTGQMARDEADRPSHWTYGTIARLPNRDGIFDDEKSTVDAEAIEIVDGHALIAFERFHRIQRYNLNQGLPQPMAARFPHPIPSWEIRANEGFEALLKSNVNSALGGALVVFTEGSINKAGNIFAAVLSGARQGVFFVQKRDDFKITDAVSLPDGNILLLERRFDMRRGVAMRLRKILASDIKPNATIDGDVVLDADFAFQIDNMEGMDLWRDKEGRLRLGLISDDNRSFLQRSLYLEFIIDEKAL